MQTHAAAAKAAIGETWYTHAQYDKKHAQNVTT